MFFTTDGLKLAKTSMNYERRGLYGLIFERKQKKIGLYELLNYEHDLMIRVN